MLDKYYSRLAADLIITRINNGKKEMLMQLRQNTGYMDNMYEPACGGHVEEDESFVKTIIREAKEEIGIEVKEEDLKFLSLYHSYKTNHVLLFFTVDKYKGTPSILEPEKDGGLKWFDIENLPENTIPYLPQILDGLKHGIKYYDNDTISIFK